MQTQSKNTCPTNFTNLFFSQISKFYEFQSINIINIPLLALFWGWIHVYSYLGSLEIYHIHVIDWSLWKWFLHIGVIPTASNTVYLQIWRFIISHRYWRIYSRLWSFIDLCSSPPTFQRHERSTTTEHNGIPCYSVRPPTVLEIALGNWVSGNYRNLSEFWRQTAAQLFYDRFRGVFGANSSFATVSEVFWKD